MVDPSVHEQTGYTQVMPLAPPREFMGSAIWWGTMGSKPFVEGGNAHRSSLFGGPYAPGTSIAAGRLAVEIGTRRSGGTPCGASDLRFAISAVKSALFFSSMVNPWLAHSTTIRTLRSSRWTRRRSASSSTTAAPIDGQGYTLLPNIRCDQIQYKEGIEPPAARFSYILDEVAASNNGWPSQFDQIWPLTVTPSPYVVANDDELVVLALLPDNTTRVLFHGFARVPQTDLIAGEPERHVRRGRRGHPLLEHADRRDASNATPIILRTETTSRPTCRFASTRPASGPGPSAGICPIARRTATTSAREAPTPIPYSSTPTSTDRQTRARSGASPRRSDTSWRTGIPRRWARSSTTPISASSTALLQNRRPLTGAEFFDPSNAATYQTDPNRIRDYDATNKPWPEVVAELLGFYGFGMRWVCSTDRVRPTVRFPRVLSQGRRRTDRPQADLSPRNRISTSARPWPTSPRCTRPSTIKRWPIRSISRPRPSATRSRSSSRRDTSRRPATAQPPTASSFARALSMPRTQPRRREPSIASTSPTNAATDTGAWRTANG